MHPSAWTTNPPKKRPTPLDSVPAPTLTITTPPSFQFTPYQTPVHLFSHRQPYILAVHEWALSALSANDPTEVPLFQLVDIDAYKQAARLELQYRGWAWPEIFDEVIPPFAPGLNYERVMKE